MAGAAADFGRAAITGEVPKPTLPGMSGPGAFDSDGSPAGMRAKPGASPKSAPQPVSVAAPDVTSQFTAYASKNPTSSHDDDIEFTHVLSRLYGMAGSSKALAMRDLNAKLQAERIREVGDNAQRTFVAGDVTPGIAMFNHMVPNGRKITGYRVNPDGTYAFQMEDGSTETRSKDQLAAQFATFTNPAMIGTMMQARAKSLADMQKEMGVAAVKHQFSLQEAMANGMIRHESAVALERLKQSGEKPTVYQQVGGDAYVTTAGGKVFKEVVAPGMDGKPQKTWVPAQLPGAPTPTGAAPTQGGYAIDAAALARAGLAVGR